MPRPRFGSDDDDDTSFEANDTYLSKRVHPQRATVDGFKFYSRQAKLFVEQQSLVVRDVSHAKAVIGGIFSEAVRTARIRTESTYFDITPWKEAHASAISELEASCATGEPVSTVVARVVSRLSALTIFSPHRSCCGVYGTLCQDMVEIHRRRQDFVFGTRTAVNT